MEREGDWWRDPAGKRAIRFGTPGLRPGKSHNLRPCLLISTTNSDRPIRISVTDKWFKLQKDSARSELRIWGDKSMSTPTRVSFRINSNRSIHRKENDRGGIRSIFLELTSDLVCEDQPWYDGRRAPSKRASVWADCPSWLVWKLKTVTYDSSGQTELLIWAAWLSFSKQPFLFLISLCPGNQSEWSAAVGPHLFVEASSRREVAPRPVWIRTTPLFFYSPLPTPLSPPPLIQSSPLSKKNRPPTNRAAPSAKFSLLPVRGARTWSKIANWNSTGSYPKKRR